MSRRRLQLRRASSRAPRDRPSRPDIDPIARIDALTSAGRANWLALLGYLAFVMVTTLGVEDIDFFVDSRQTQLPLVNVSIPTVSFFVFAPILGAALYVHLHLHVRKVAEALAEAPAGRSRLEERIAPWMLNDFILRERRDRERVIRARPLDRLAGVTSGFLVWWAGPVVLMLMWARTWPAHELWLSLLCAACLLVSIYAGLMSWTKTRQDLRRWGNRAGRLCSIGMGFLMLPIIFLTWANSRGLGEDNLVVAFASEEVDGSGRGTANSDPVGRSVSSRVWRAIVSLIELDPIDLKRERLTAQPINWVYCGAALKDFRIEFAEREALPIRGAWPDQKEKEFSDEWLRRRQSVMAQIENLDLSEFDMRKADFSETFAIGLILPERWWAGANFHLGMLEGSRYFDTRTCRPKWNLLPTEGGEFQNINLDAQYLINSNFNLAELSGASLINANLTYARMNQADLSWTSLDGAILYNVEALRTNLSWSSLHGANLAGAKLAGASLENAMVVGSNLDGAIFKRVNWMGATLQTSTARNSDFRGGVGLTQFHFSSSVGNARTLLPDSPDPESGQLLYIPSCWKSEPELWSMIVTATSDPFLEKDEAGIEDMLLRETYLCAPGEVPQRTGTPWPVDRDPPWVNDANWQAEDRGPAPTSQAFAPPAL